MDDESPSPLRIVENPKPALNELAGVAREQALAFANRLVPGQELPDQFDAKTGSLAESEHWRVETAEGVALDVWLATVPRGVVFLAGTTQQVGEIFDARVTHSMPEVALLAEAAQRLPAGSVLSRFGKRAQAVRAHEERVTPPAPPPGPAFEGDIVEGTQAFALWRGRWWPARISSVSGERYCVHYDGWGSEWDEFVPRERLCRAPPPPDVRVDDRVSVEYRGAWYAATVLAVHDDGRLRVSYEGWDSSWDEDVVPARVKVGDDQPELPGSELGDTKLEPGSSVFIEYDGAWYAGSVLEVHADGYLIHYDDWDSSWDEVVDVARLRAR